MTTSYTADELLEQVRRGGSLPSAAVTGTADADILAHADAELRDTLVPLMLGVQEEFYQRVFDQTVVSGTAGYRINKRAALSRINTVQWVNPDGSGYDLSRIDPKRSLQLGINTLAQGQPSAYYLEGSRVVLWPTPNASGTLRIRAFVRPSRLSLIADSSSTNLAISAVSVLAVDATATQTAATTVTIPNSSFTSVPIVGDSLCVPDLTPYIQLPVELHPSLVELTVARVLRSLGKKSEAADHAEAADKMVAIAIQALAPRVDSAERKIVGGPHWRRARGALAWGGR